MYPVVASDLDGTLLNTKHELSSYTQQIIRQLSKMGVEFVFATGRHYVDVEIIRSQLSVSMYLITSNGARAYDPNGKVVVSHDICPDYIQPLIDIGRKYSDKVVTSIYRTDSWHVEQKSERLLKYNKDSGFRYTVQPLDKVSRSEVQKIFFNAKHHEDVKVLANEITESYGDRLSMTYSLPTFFEVMAPNVCKATTLADVLSIEGRDLQDVIAFGDGLNDYEMLIKARKGVVMGNSSKQLKAKLPDHEEIGLANDNAVAKYLAVLYGI
ncbi:MAG: Cof-type HAD-IIB family hydrolase [Candidatus Endonucleobacter sp. (ex Gigantidas childressi)]|nr:Cof-type HAD-IIB family hydrolase [Candidatus Endonucleobacter sp. (ex Gigantidas childressi)]